MSRQSFVEYEPAPTSGADTFVRPSIHRVMLEDMYRTESFRNALTVAVQPGMVVLDIGAGTGVLSCFAVQSGAEHVYAVESSRFVDHTRRIVELNGMADRITVIEGDSRDITLPRRADLLVTEIMGHIGIDENILDVVADAQERLLTREALVIPNCLSLIANPVWAPDFEDIAQYWQKRPYGLDLSSVADQTLRSIYVTSLKPQQRLSLTGTLIDLPLGGLSKQKPTYPLHGEATFEFSDTITVHGVSVGFSAALYPYVTLDSRSTTSWMDSFFPIPTPFKVHPGDRMSFELTIHRPSEQQFRCQWSGGVVGDETRQFCVTQHQ